MATFIVVDAMNLAFRVRHGMRAPDMHTTVGLAIHTIFSSFRKVWQQFDADHLVVALEGRSWRKDYYAPYKAHRRDAAQQRSQEEKDDDQVFFEAMDDLIRFLTKKTNASVLKSANAEADDMIARWIQLHPQDQHVIVSTDSDFHQLLAPNVKIYNGIAGILYTHTGVWDKDGNPALNKQSQPLDVPNPALMLFEKIIRGDPGDNVMSAFPGVRKTRIHQAFENRHEQGYAWNNLMLTKWTDHQGHEIRVRDAYERNRILIDLTAQPTDLIQQFDNNIQEIVNQPHKTQVGTALMQFANAWGLVKIEKNARDFSVCLSRPYEGALLNKQ